MAKAVTDEMLRAAHDTPTFVYESQTLDEKMPPEHTG